LFRDLAIEANGRIRILAVAEKCAKAIRVEAFLAVESPALNVAKKIQSSNWIAASSHAPKPTTPVSQAHGGDDVKPVVAQ